MNILTSKNFLLALVVVQTLAIVVLVSSKLGSTQSTESSVISANNTLESKVLPPVMKLNQTSSRKAIDNEIVSPKEEAIEEPEMLTAEQITVQNEAAINVSSVFDNALTVGEWTNQDTMEFVKHRRNLSSEDLTLLRQRFHAAFNAQQLNIKHFPPL